MSLKKSISLFICCSMLFSAPVVYADNVQMKEKARHYELVFSVPVASEKGAVAYTPNVEDLEKRGPKSFTVDSEGQFYILDTIDSEIEIYDARGNSLSTISLPEDREFFDIEIDNKGNIYVVNDMGETYQYFGDKLISIQTHDKARKVEGLFVNENKDVVLKFQDTDHMNLSGKQTVNRESGFKGTVNEEGVKLSSSRKTINVKYNFEAAGTYPLVENNGGDTFVLENEALIGKDIYVETRVGKYGPNGNLLESALAISTKNAYAVKVPHKYIHVTQDGNVYQLVLEEDMAAIYKLSFSKERQTNIDRNLIKTIEPQKLVDPSDKKGTVTTLAATRADAVNRARDMWLFVWQYDPKTMKTPNNSTTAPPQHLASATAGAFVGIPYDWGGMNGIDTGTSGVNINYADGLAAGKTAGDINSSATSTSTVGLDCSGYISAAYNFGTKYGTSTLSTVFKNTTWTNIVQGDIGNKSGVHTWMFIHFNKNSNGERTGVYTYEATTDGSEDRAKYWDRTWADAQTYTPMTLK